MIMKGLIKRGGVTSGVWVCMLLACGLARSNAQIIPLTDGNSTALINAASQAGMFHWDIQGQNQLQQQWFWYGIGGGPVSSIDTLGAPTITPKGPNEAIVTYTAPGLLSISVDYLLTGGTIVGSGQHATADIGESIRINNLSPNPLPLHFYQYSHFNLGGANSDTVQLTQNARGLFNEADQTSPGVGLSETVTTPGANLGEVAPLGGTLAKLNSGGPVTLGPPFFAGPLGPGAVTWAFEWDFVGGANNLLLPGGSALISKDKYLDIVVPEPSAVALMILGAIGLVSRKQRPKA